MRILEIFARYTRPGGEETAANNIHREIEKFSPIDRVWIDNAEWLAPGAPNRFKQALRMFSNPDALRRIAAGSDKFRADIWLAHNIYQIVSPAIYPFAAKRGIPILQYVHNYRPFSVSGYLWARGRVAEEGLRQNYAAEILDGAWQRSIPKSLLMASVLWHAHARGWFDHVSAWIVLSRSMRDSFVEAGMASDRVHLLPHSWNYTGDAGESMDDGYYLFLANLIEAKGVRTLLEAWNQMAKSKNCPNLVVAGEGPLESEVARAAEANPFIRIHGWVKGGEKADLLRGCRAVLVPSIWREPLPTVVYEAFNYSKPVIGSATGGIPDLVLNEENGYLFQPGNQDGLIDAIRECERDASRRLTLGRNGHQRLATHHDSETWREHFKDIVRQTQRGRVPRSVVST